MQLRNVQLCNIEQCEYQATFTIRIAHSVVACCTDRTFRSCMLHWSHAIDAMMIWWFWIDALCYHFVTLAGWLQTDRMRLMRRRFGGCLDWCSMLSCCCNILEGWLQTGRMRLMLSFCNIGGMITNRSHAIDAMTIRWLSGLMLYAIIL